MRRANCVLRATYFKGGGIVYRATYAFVSFLGAAPLDEDEEEAVA